MPRAHLVNSIPIERTPRVMQLEGLFEVPPTQESRREWTVNLPCEERNWNIGLIVGPSGSGKSTIACELFGQALIEQLNWPAEKSIVDAFPAEMGIKEITALLSSVGFSSPPSWLRPFHALSLGEQFRVTIARALSLRSELIVIDEFTSVVDRTVARIGSAAVAGCVRRRSQKLIAVACHYDIIEWLQPDWIYQPHLDQFHWRTLQRRPDILLEITRVHASTWKLFERHHYLSSQLNPSARCFAAFLDGRLVAFTAVLPFPHPIRPGWREHRTVCLPDYQGVGIGNTLSSFVAGLYHATGKPYRSTTSNPAMLAGRAKSTDWKLTRGMSRKPQRHQGNLKFLSRSGSTQRLTASFEYVGSARTEDAHGFGLL